MKKSQTPRRYQYQEPGQRIYKSKLYLMRVHPGISGFQQWETWEYYITTGHKAQNDRGKVYKEYIPTPGAGLFRLEDGHLPAHQPRVTGPEAVAWLRANPYQRITPTAQNIDG